MPDSLSPEAVVPCLRGRLGRPYEHVGSTRSTQLLLAADAAEGALVAAEEQTEGRGRLGRRWLAPYGTSLLCSLQLRPAVRGERLPELTGVAAQAVAETLAALSGLEPELKFPNDVLLDGRKVAGVLAEARERRVVLGIGINVGSTAWPGSGFVEADRLDLLIDVLERLEHGYDSWLRTLSAA